MSSLQIAIVGSGSWGLNHVKTAVQELGGENVWVCDSRPEAESKVKVISDKVNFTTDYELILNNSYITGVIIATPAETHHALAKRALEKAKHTLVEKPITLNSEDARDLIATAKRMDRRLMVGHVLLFHPAVVKLKKMVTDGRIGKLQYIYSNRLNLGAIRTEENSLWSFAPHDISILQLLIEKRPLSVEAKGGAFVQTHVEDTTLTYLNYPDGIHAHIFVSWLHPFKEQRLVVIGDEGMLVFEDTLKTDKLKFYKKGFTHVNGKIEKFDVDFESVEFGAGQPLAEEHKHFYECIKHNRKPLTDGEHALEVLEILEQAQERLKTHV